MAKKPKKQPQPLPEGKPALPEDFVGNSVEDYATYVAEWEDKVNKAKDENERGFAERTLRYWQLALANAKVNQNE
jgi:cyclopropane fatty-acyl-phospholipid synthase-like methyltransferase